MITPYIRGHAVSPTLTNLFKTKAPKQNHQNKITKTKSPKHKIVPSTLHP
jgi:hypothetical protein